MFEHEPKVPQALLGSDEAVLLPRQRHAETRQDMEDLMLENLRVLRDGPRGDAGGGSPSAARSPGAQQPDR